MTFSICLQHYELKVEYKHYYIPKQLAYNISKYQYNTLSATKKVVFKICRFVFQKRKEEYDGRQHFKYFTLQNDKIENS